MVHQPPAMHRAVFVQGPPQAHRARNRPAPSGSPAADDAVGVSIDDEGGIDGARSDRHVSEIREPQPGPAPGHGKPGSRGRAAGRSLVRQGCPDRLAAALEAHAAHHPLDGATGDRDDNGIHMRPSQPVAIANGGAVDQQNVGVVDRGESSVGPERPSFANRTKRWLLVQRRDLPIDKHGYFVLSS